MSYAKALDKLINESGMTAKEVSDRCKEKGQDVTASYISILRNESKNRKASPELSKALEEVLGAENGILAVEAYLENAPEAVIKTLEILRTTIINAIPGISSLPADKKKAAAEMIPLSEIVIEAAKQDETGIANTVATYKPAAPLEITDNSMSPILIKGDKAYIQPKTEYASGDVVCVLNGETIFFRNLAISETGKKFLIPTNGNAPICEVNDSIKILGVVSSITRKI